MSDCLSADLEYRYKCFIAPLCEFLTGVYTLKNFGDAQLYTRPVWKRVALLSQSSVDTFQHVLNPELEIPRYMGIKKVYCYKTKNPKKVSKSSHTFTKVLARHKNDTLYSWTL